MAAQGKVATGKKLLTSDEEAGLIKRWQKENDQRAGRRLELAFEPLLKKITRDVYNRFHRVFDYLDIDDVRSEVTVAFYTALNRFDASHGARLATYIKASVHFEVGERIRRQNQIVDLPSSEKLRAVVSQLARNPADEKDPSSISRATEIDVTRVTQMVSAFHRPVRLNHSLASDHSDGNQFTEGALKDLWHRENEDAEEVLAQEEMRALQRSVLVQYLASLSERERYIITHRYGLHGGDPKSLNDLHEELGITRERVRQIQVAAVDILKDEVFRHFRGSKAHLEALFTPEALSEHVPQTAEAERARVMFEAHQAVGRPPANKSAAPKASNGAKNQRRPQQIDMFEFIATLEPQGEASPRPVAKNPEIPSGVVAKQKWDRSAAYRSAFVLADF